MKYECWFPIRKASSIFSLKLGFLKAHNAAAPASPPHHGRIRLSWLQLDIVTIHILQQGVGAKTIPKEPNERKKKKLQHIASTT